MKLRILGNTLRLRLTQSEVAAFGAQGRVEERIMFGAGVSMTYALQKAEGIEHLAAHYDAQTLTVLVPAGWVTGWVDTNKVGLEGEQQVDGDVALSILIEKDFKCLHGDESRIDADAFPNPLAQP